MNEYIKALKRHVVENPPNYGDDAHSILEMLYAYYHECNNTGNDAVKAAFAALWQIMNNWDVFIDYTWANRKKL